jgi:hypothetical protein
MAPPSAALRDGCRVGDYRSGPQAPLNRKSGFTVLSGLAWSGRGKIGGWTFRRRRPQLAGRQDRWSDLGQGADAVLLQFDWDGRELLRNRAPWTRPATCSRPKASCASTAALTRSIHNNGIQTWHVHKNGEVRCRGLLARRRFRRCWPSAGRPGVLQSAPASIPDRQRRQ